MGRILAFTSGPSDWEALLADPDNHWVTGYSARTLAHCWEAANGFPPEVAAVFAQSHDPLLKNLSPIVAIPEFKVPLPGGNRPSQNDVFVLAQSCGEAVSIMVEGKVDEPFGPTLDEWRTDASPGKVERLRFLLAKLGLIYEPHGNVRYQLFHRAASAIIVGEQFRAEAAVLIVHSFSEKRTGWQDYESFLGLFGIEAEANKLQRVTDKSSIPLFAAWVCGNCAFLKS